jgi:hypothetical protein
MAGKKSSTNVESVSNSLREKIKAQSAEDKLKKSLKSLSYTSGTSGGSTSRKTTKSTTTSSSKTTASKGTTKEARKKVGGVVLDVETIQDASKQKFETRGKRNNVIILLLVLVLVVSLVFLAITIVDYQRAKKSPNLRYSIQGTAGDVCEWSIAGGSRTKFIMAEGLASGLQYDLDSYLNVKTPAGVCITIEIIALLHGEPIQVEVAYDIDHNKTFERVHDESGNVFKYIDSTYVGGGVVHVFDGIDFTDAPYNLSSSNIEIEVVAYVDYI